MPAPLLGIVGGQEDLRDGNAVAGERFLVGVGEANLPGGCGGLLLFEPQPPPEEAEISAAYRDCPGRYQDHLLATGTAAGDVVGQGIEPRAADLAVVGGPQGRTDLHNEPPRKG